MPQSSRPVAVRALGDTGDRRAVKELIRELQDSEVQCDAVRALGKIGDPRAVQALCGAVIGNDKRLGADAASALASIGDPSAFPALRQALPHLADPGGTELMTTFSDMEEEHDHVNWMNAIISAIRQLQTPKH